MPINGLVVMTPTSIASTGTGNSSSINADGSVDFSLCETLSLNGVFTSSYDNYMIAARHVATTNVNLLGRYRVSGTDATGSNYAEQYIIASGTVNNALLTTSLTSMSYMVSSSETRSATTIYVFGPQLAQPTVSRSMNALGRTGARVFDYTHTHSLSTSYDGFTLTINTAGHTFTGLITVFGFNQ